MRLGLPTTHGGAGGRRRALTAILTGEAYATSAEMAEALGPFPAYDRNRDDMLRVIRNHRRAAYDATAAEYEGLTVAPTGLDPASCPEDLLLAARDAWDRALEGGERHGYRNAQVTVLAPTGTIGLVMDCDTTGRRARLRPGQVQEAGRRRLLPDHQLRGAHRAPAAGLLRRRRSRRSSATCRGTGTLDGAPGVDLEALRAKGLPPEAIARIEAQLPSAFDLSFVAQPLDGGGGVLRRRPPHPQGHATRPRTSTSCGTSASPASRSAAANDVRLRHHDRGGRART